MQSMRTHSKLVEGNAKSVNSMAECIMWLNNEPISRLQKVPDIEGHLWAQPTLRGNPIGLDKLLVNVILDDPVQLLFGG